MRIPWPGLGIILVRREKISAELLLILVCSENFLKAEIKRREKISCAVTILLRMGQLWPVTPAIQTVSSAIFSLPADLASSLASSQLLLLFLVLSLAAEQRQQLPVSYADVANVIAPLHLEYKKVARSVRSGAGNFQRMEDENLQEKENKK